MPGFRSTSLAVVVSALVTACVAQTASQPALPCSGRACALSIQNDAGIDLAARFADTTGREGLLGLVAPRAIRVFQLQWIKSARVRVMVMTRNGDRFDANVPLLATRTTEVHFPADFVAVDDGINAVAALSGSGHRVP